MYLWVQQQFTKEYSPQNYTKYLHHGSKAHMQYNFKRILLLECDNNPQKSIFLKSDALGVGLDKHFKFFYPISNGVVYCEWSKELNLMYHASPLKYVESYLSLVGELTRDSKAVHGAYSIDGSPLMYVLIFNPPVNYGDIVQKFEYEDLFLEHIKNERDKALLKDFGDAQARMRLPASMN